MPAYLIVFLGAGLGEALRHGVNVAALRLLLLLYDQFLNRLSQWVVRA